MTNSFAELEDANCIFIIGSNTTVAHPLVATRMYRAKAKGAKIIVADPREIQMARFADVYVRQRLGSDVALINGMMNAIYKNGWHNQKFVEERTENFQAFLDVMGASQEGTSRIDLLLEGEEHDLANASKIVSGQGGEVLGLGTYREKWGESPVCYLRMRTADPERIADALKQKGFAILGVHL